MGVRRLADIAALFAGGLPAEIPAVVIQNGTLPEQTSVVSTLGRLAHDVVACGIGSPGVVVVGAVAALARQGDIAAPDRSQARGRS